MDAQDVFQKLTPYIKSCLSRNGINGDVSFEGHKLTISKQLSKATTVVIFTPAQAYEIQQDDSPREISKGVFLYSNAHSQTNRLRIEPSIGEILGQKETRVYHVKNDEKGIPQTEWEELTNHALGDFIEKLEKEKQSKVRPILGQSSLRP